LVYVEIKTLKIINIDRVIFLIIFCLNNIYLRKYSCFYISSKKYSGLSKEIKKSNLDGCYHSSCCIKTESQFLNYIQKNKKEPMKSLALSMSKRDEKFDF